MSAAGTYWMYYALQSNKVMGAIFGTREQNNLVLDTVLVDYFVYNNIHYLVACYYIL